MIRKVNEVERVSLIRPILLMTMLIVTIFTASQLTDPIVFANTATSNTLTVSVSGSTYTVKSPSGTNLYTSSSAAQAINSALSNVPAGGTVYMSAGIYPISSQISGGKDGVTLTGDVGVTIKATATMGYMFLWAGSSSNHLDTFTLSNIIFDGGRTTAWPDTGTNGFASGPSIKYVDHVVVDKITIQNTKRIPPTKGPDGLSLSGVSGAPVTDLEVKNSHFYNIYGSGIAIQYATSTNIHDNTFVDCAQWYPIGGAVYAGDGVSYITIQRNNISSHSDNDGIYIGTSQIFATNSVITDNTINLQLYWKGGGEGTGAGTTDASQKAWAATHAGSGIKIYGINSELARNTINWNNAHYGSWPCYNYCIEDWGAGNNIHDNTLSNARVGIGFFSVSGKQNGGNVVTENYISECVTTLENSGGNTISGNTVTATTSSGSTSSGSSNVSTSSGSTQTTTIRQRRNY